MGEQIGQFLFGHILFQPLRHQRFAAALQGFEIRPQQDVLLAVRTEQRDTAAGFVHQDAAEDQAVVGCGQVFDEFGFDGPIRIEDRREQELGV